jgi:hypothetical protein
MVKISTNIDEETLQRTKNRDNSKQDDG